MIAFAHAQGDVRSLLSVLRATLGFRNVTTIKKADSAGWHRKGSTVVKLDADEDSIQAAVDAAMNAGSVTIFQRHATFVPGGPMA